MVPLCQEFPMFHIFVGKGEVALSRWPTTIGGWKTIEKSDGSMALKYKGPRKLVDW